MDFGDPAASLLLSIAQIKFVGPLVCYLTSLIIILIAKYADNYSSSLTSKAEFDLVSDDMSKAHAKLNLPLMLILHINIKQSEKKRNTPTGASTNLKYLDLHKNLKLIKI